VKSAAQGKVTKIAAAKERRERKERRGILRSLRSLAVDKPATEFMKML
jgi:hypothetical protein